VAQEVTAIAGTGGDARPPLRSIMIMTPTSTITPDQNAIVTEIDIAALPERVFQALTDPAQLMLWWGAPPHRSFWEMDARRGGKWRFEISDPSGKMVVNGVSSFKAHGEITEFDPPPGCWLTPGWVTGMTIPTCRPRHAGSCRRPKPAPGSKSLTAVSLTNRLPARITPAAGPACSRCSENIAHEKEETNHGYQCSDSR
jgi:uncharacterized protein YndB with AHSA1/START domain